MTEDKTLSAGNAVRILRLRACLSLREVADYTGIHFTYLSKIETDQRVPKWIVYDSIIAFIKGKLKEAEISEKKAIKVINTFFL